MKTRWTVVKTILLLGALPLVATAAASAHQWLSDTTPISVEDVVTTPSDQLSSERVHTIALNRAGAIEGRIASIDSETRESSGLAKLKIFFVQNGKIANETITSDDGTFVVDGIAEGAYSFIASGKTGFAAYGVHVVSYNGAETVNTMEAAAVSPHFSAVRKILQDKLPVEVAEEILSSSDLVSEQVVGANRVRLQNGSLKGNVVPIVGKVESVEGTYVHIIKDDQTIAEVLVDEQGKFTVPDLQPGVYAFVAAGEQGFAAVSFEAVIQEEIGSISELIDTEEVPVGLPAVAVDPQEALTTDIPADAGASVSDTMDVSLTGAQDSAFVGDQLNVAGGQYYDDITYSAGYGEIEYAGAADNIGYGCAAGGSCGACGDYSGYSACCGAAGGGAGGGAFVGGGRFARIAGLAGLGIAIAALATSGGDTFVGGGGGGFPPPPPPQSPFVPPNPGNNYGNYYDGYYGGGYDNYYYGGGYNYGGGYGGGYNNSYGGYNNNYGGYNNNSYNTNSGGYGSSFYN